MNYQVKWHGQFTGKVVSTIEEAEVILQQVLVDYKESCEAGWVPYFKPEAVQISTTTKKVGEY